MKRLLLLAVLVLTTNQLQARLAETEQELEARYGKPVTQAETFSGKRMVPKNEFDKYAQRTKPYSIKDVRFYIFNGFRITVSLLDGKSQCESISKIGESLSDQIAFTDDEIQILLEANAGSGKWELAPKGKTTGWLLIDNDKAMAVAFETKDKYELTVMTEDFLTYLQKSGKDDALKHMQGF